MASGFKVAYNLLEVLIIFKLCVCACVQLCGFSLRFNRFPRLNSGHQACMQFYLLSYLVRPKCY